MITGVALPAPLSDRRGWPWEPASPGDWTVPSATIPRISIITPSYNQGRYLEQTIRSVLAQDYPNLEYIVIDGGSTDQSVEILKHYSSRIQYWISEPDGGQTMAINKGLRRCTGEIIGYLNSDDYYLPGALPAVARAFLRQPGADLIYGRCAFVDEHGEPKQEHFGSITSFREILDLWGVWWAKRQLVQPEVFWTRRIMNRIGHFDENLTYAMDYDYWVRILRAGSLAFRLDYPTAAFRFHAAQKSTAREKAATELLQIVKSYLWEKRSPVPWSERFKLQNHWLYQSVFLKEVTDSLGRNEGRWARYESVGKVLLAYPQILLDEGFRGRLLSLLKIPSRTRDLL
jgi:glycosyltransferase involved in cell wall biosynthesis